MRAHILGLFILTCLSITNGKELVEVNILGRYIGKHLGDECLMDNLDNPGVDDSQQGEFDRFVGSELHHCEGHDFSDVVSMYVKHTGTDTWTFDFIRLAFDDMTYVDCGEGRTSVNFEEGILIPCK